MSPARILPLLAALLTACTPDKQPPVTPDTPGPPPPLHPAEAALAAQYQSDHRPDLALAVLAAHPAHEATRSLLANTRWHIPAAHLEHPGCEIHHLALLGTSLWVAVKVPPFHTIIRWNLESLEIESILFPTREPFRAIVLSPTGGHAVVTRGDVSLLIDAQSLKPIAHLGPLPVGVTPESAIAFTHDSVLFAHPGGDGWHIRDTATGEIIRSIPHDEPPFAGVLAAQLDHHRLRLLTADGTRIDAPISPIEPIDVIPFDSESLEILHAHLVHRGHTAIIIRHLGPHEAPAAIEFALADASTPPFDLDAWATRQPHSPLPGLSTGLLRYLTPPPVALGENTVRFHGTRNAPLITSTPPTAFAANTADTAILATAEATGRITVHRPIAPPPHPTHETLTAIAGHQYHRDTAALEALTAETRHPGRGSQAPVTAPKSPEGEAVAGKSRPQPPTPKEIPVTFRTTTPTAILPLWHRLTDALPPGSPDLKSLPDIATPTDHTPAHTLANALTRNDPARIAAILESAENFPSTLRTLATAHLHYRIGSTAAAFEPYIHGFPDLHAIRQREDWRGWEQPDFQPAVATLERAYQSIIATLTIDPEAGDAARRESIARLTDPAALETLGRARFATACLNAATTLSSIPGESQSIFTLATLARHHGAPVVPCLRAEALALTALEEYAEAHTRWIKLITDHPAATHLPGDYTEAAYTAFENADPRQALEILITGMRRFGEDPAFALRAAWIALLTDHPDHARAFLLKGRDAGFPEDQLEHATALLTASAVLTQNADAATAHFQDLITLDPTWADPETIEALSWPEHLKAPLRQLTW